MKIARQKASFCLLSARLQFGRIKNRESPMNKNPAASPACASRASMPSDRHVSTRTLCRTVLVACLCAAALAALPAHAGSVSYSYDALGRLASAVYADGTSTTTITYSYDAAGNRTSVATTSP
jgi:YD repeat-containing protein